MIWCRYKVGDKIAYGTLENDIVTEFEGTPFGEHKATQTKHPLSSVKLLAPTIPSNFFCVGVNYPDHIRKMAAKRNVSAKFPEQPDVGYRSNNAIINPEEDIVKPKDAHDDFQYEGELVAIFGKTGKNIPKEKALDYVLGWTIGNDVSERTWQRGDRTLWRAKNSDTFKPMGPWITTGLDYKKMTTTVRVNGKVTDEFKTGDMIFDVETYISELSKYCTIHAGDMMWMGTDGEPANLKPGDVVEVEITGLGVLRNKVVAGT